jgi:anti-sigma factor RsiW
MSTCEKHTVDLMLYLDDELVGEELMEFLAHLKICADCRASLEEQLALSAVLRRSRPLYSAPPKLRARVAASLAYAASETESNQLYKGSGQWLRRTLQGVERLIPRWRVLVPAVLGMILCFLLISNVVREARASEYVDAALSAHRGYLSGHLPLEIQSDSPQAVTGWLAGKVAFPFRLPDSQAQPSGAPAYRLLGARVVDYRGSQAGLVTYEAPQNDTISLLVASSKYAVVAGGVEVHSGSLVFHHRMDAGFQIITWSNHGLAYALVSRAAGSAQGSCLVCHQSMADRNTFRPVYDSMTVPEPVVLKNVHLNCRPPDRRRRAVHPASIAPFPGVT